MHSVKYILHLFLCEGGCVYNILGMGPGFVSISPLSISSRCGENVWVVRGFSPIMWIVYRSFLLFLLFIVLVFRFVI